MGLDMYLHKLPQGDRDQEQRVMYWRKANAIHRWFTQDTKEDNCVDFPKTIEDIQRRFGVCVLTLLNKKNHCLKQALVFSGVARNMIRTTGKTCKIQPTRWRL